MKGVVPETRAVRPRQSPARRRRAARAKQRGRMIPSAKGIRELLTRTRDIGPAGC